MKFSIIIPVYNVEKYLRQCLDSVLAQTYPDWEAICVNDVSTDSSLAILNEFATKDNRFVLLNHETNLGTWACRNDGVSAAKGEYVLFLDSDDWIEHDTFEILCQDAKKGYDMLCFQGKLCYGDREEFGKPDKEVDRAYVNGMDYFNENALVSREFAFVCVVRRAYRRSFLLEHNICFKGFYYHEDNYYTPIACYYANSVKVVNACLYNYRQYLGSKITQKSEKRKMITMEIANELADFFVPKKGFDKTKIYQYINYRFFMALSAPKVDLKELHNKCNWKHYYKVSRTKLSHKLYYLRNRLKHV